MLSRSLRFFVFFLIVAGLLSLGNFPNNVQAQASTGRLNIEANAPVFQTGSIFTQPVDPAGKLFQSSWLDPDGSDYDQYVWDNFTLQSDQSITEIDWSGGYDPAKFGSGGAVLDFSVEIFGSSAAGLQPDVINPPLAQYQTGGKAGEVSIGVVGGTPMYSYAFSLPTPFTATAGVKYWVQIEAFQHGAPDWGIAAGTGGNGSYFRKTASPGGDGLYQSMPGDSAFTLLGPTTDTITSTPPATETATLTVAPISTSTEMPVDISTATTAPINTPTPTPKPPILPCLGLILLVFLALVTRR